MTGTLIPIVDASIDGIPIAGTSIEMLDLPLVSTHIRTAVRSNRYNGPEDPVLYLRRQRCLVEVDGQLSVTLAGLLCFGKDPQTLYPNAVVDLGQYRGTKPTSTDATMIRKNLGGTIFQQLEQAITFVSERMQTRSVLLPQSITRIDITEYPQVVCRELCLNMLCHRDYVSERAASRIMLLSDRIEWISPGGLQPGMTIENILYSQKSRNPIIMSICYEAGLVESFGQGLDTVVEELARESLRPPVFLDTGHSFNVTVYGRDMATDQGIATDRVYQRLIIEALATRGRLTMFDLVALFPERARRTLQRDLATMVDDQQIVRRGGGRSIYYTLVEDPHDA